MFGKTLKDTVYISVSAFKSHKGRIITHRNQINIVILAIVLLYQIEQNSLVPPQEYLTLHLSLIVE